MYGKSTAVCLRYSNASHVFVVYIVLHVVCLSVVDSGCCTLSPSTRCSVTFQHSNFSSMKESFSCELLFSHSFRKYLTCAQKLPGSQFSLLHDIETKKTTKRKLKQKLLSSSESVRQSSRFGIYGGKDL